MELKQRHYNVLTVSAQPKFNESLSALISERRHYEQELEESISGAKRRLLEKEFDFIIINAPLPDNDGVHLAIERSSKSGCAVLLLVGRDYYERVFEKVCPYGVYTLAKPSPRQLVTQAFDWLESTRERLMSFEKKSANLEDKMQEIRLINRAKWLMIEKGSMSEEEAHHMIEKLAMDKCVPKRTIAEQIIRHGGI